MLWIWGDASPTAFIDSAAKSAAFLPELDPADPSRTASGEPVLEIAKKYSRDVPYSWSALVENLMDTSHVPFAHHGVLGNR
jgi:phenylpropionate dioxygenase-like ring-hydroxylating dioxygenase large terminal subunit